MLIDVHGHIGPSSPGAAKPAQLAQYAASCGIERMLISNRDAAVEPHEAANLDETDANMVCLEACRTHPVLAPLFWVRPGQVDSNVRAFAGALKTEPFVGAVFAPAEGGFDAAARLLDAYLAVLAAAARPAVFCISADERAGPAKVYELARRQPDVPIVLCVCGGATQRAAALDVVQHASRRADADLYVDTSHAEAAEICAAVRALGSTRVLFGSDAPGIRDSHTARIAGWLAELRDNLPTDVFQQVSGDNAVRLFRLPPAAA